MESLHNTERNQVFNMYVWVVGKAIPTKKNNMLGSFEFEQAMMLANRGIKVVYIGLDFRPFHHIRKWGINKTTINSVPCYEYSLPIRPFPLLQRKVEYFFCRKLYGIIERENGMPDVIHVHFPSIINALVHREYQGKGSKIVATEHFTKVLTKDLSHIYVNNLKWFADNANAMLCVGAPLKQSIIDLTDTKKEILIVPNIVNHAFKYVPKKLSDKYIFIGIGRLVWVKRFDLMINAFATVFSKDDQVELRIVGGGNEYENLNKQIEMMGRGHQIHLLGVKTREETAYEIQQSDALICASNLETFGVPIIEAWACGKPAIGTDALGFLEYMRDELGVIVKANDENQMQEGIKAVYQRRNEYRSKEISDYANRCFGEEAIFSKLDKIYKTVIDK